MRFTWSLALLPLALAAAPLHGQSEAELKRHFEGRRITLKIAMPGTEEGVDVYPGTEQPLDYPRYAERLKDKGTAIPAGADAMITKIRVKSKHIEFHLDGGGYGTLSDETSTDVYVAPAEKSNREKSLERELEREQDPGRRREIRDELDDLKSERQREDARNQAEVAGAEEQKEENIRQRRLAGGSRFNVRYRERMPDEVLTPEGLETALAEYVEFPRLPGRVTTVAVADGAEDPDRRGYREEAAPLDGLPRKGMTAGQVQEMLGDPTTSSERLEGNLTVVTRTYRAGESQVTAEFVEDVLVRFSMTSD